MKKMLFLLLIAGGCLFAASEANAGGWRGRDFHRHSGWGRPGFSININRGYPGRLGYGYGYGGYYRPHRRSVGISVGPGYGYYGSGYYGAYPVYRGGYCY